MTFQARSLVLHGTALAGLLLLGACGKHDDQAATPPPAAHSAPAAAHTAPALATPPAAVPAVPASAPAPAHAGTTASSATQAADDAFKVQALTLGKAVGAGYKITQPLTTFEPSQNTIYASVATTGTTPGATLSAHFSYLEGKGQEVTTISQTIATDGPATTTFKLRNPNDWPAGKYKVEIAVDGKPVSSQTFEVKAA